MVYFYGLVSATSFSLISLSTLNTFLVYWNNLISISLVENIEKKDEIKYKENLNIIYRFKSSCQRNLTWELILF